MLGWLTADVVKAVVMFLAAIGVAHPRALLGGELMRLAVDEQVGHIAVGAGRIAISATRLPAYAQGGRKTGDEECVVYFVPDSGPVRRSVVGPGVTRSLVYADGRFFGARVWGVGKDRVREELELYEVDERGDVVPHPASRLRANVFGILTVADGIVAYDLRGIWRLDSLSGTWRRIAFEIEAGSREILRVVASGRGRVAIFTEDTIIEADGTSGQRHAVVKYEGRFEAACGGEGVWFVSNADGQRVLWHADMESRTVRSVLKDVGFLGGRIVGFDGGAVIIERSAGRHGSQITVVSDGGQKVGTRFIERRSVVSWAAGDGRLVYAALEGGLYAEPLGGLTR